MDYNNESERDRLDRLERERLHRMDHDRYGNDGYRTEKKAGLGIGTIVLLILAALAAWWYFSNNRRDDFNVERDGRSAVGAVERGAETVGEKVKDVAKEVPQAAKDATTDGDQKTTRPNDDESKDKLDQK